MSQHSFSVKRKAVPQQHTINLPNLSPSPKRLSNPLKSLKKMLSLSRLNTTNLSCSKDPLQQPNGAQWLPLSPLSPQSADNTAFFRPPSALTSSSNYASTSTSPTDSSFSSSSLHIQSKQSDEFSTHRSRAPEVDLATPVSQKSLLTSWYDDWFETQDQLQGQAHVQLDSDRRQEFFIQQSEPKSFFEDDSDEEDYPISDSASEYSYTSIVPSCQHSDSGSDDDDDDEDVENVTLTIGRRVTCRPASYRVFSASSSEDLHQSSSRSTTPRQRRAFELDRSEAL